MEAIKAEKRRDTLKKIHTAIDGSKPDVLVSVVKGLEPEETLSLCRSEVKPYGTALHHAAGIGQSSIISLLLDMGLDINAPREDCALTAGQTALHIAALAGKSAAVKLLLSRGAKVNAQESEGLTALHCACSGNDLDTVKTLTCAGADVNVTDHRKESPLQRSILRSTTEVSKHLMEAGADLDVRDTQGQTVLHYAVEWDNKELAGAIISTGFSVNVQDHDGCSPLHMSDSEEMTQLLVKHGGDLNLRDNCGRPPIARRIDVEQEEFQRINAVLQRHLSFEVPTELGPSSERVHEVQEKFNRLAVTPEDGQSASVHTDLMSEIRGSCSQPPKHHVPSPLSSAGVLQELRNKASSE